MRRFIFLLMLTVAACNGTGTSTSSLSSEAPTFSPLTPTIAPDTPAPVTATPGPTTNFPDPNVYAWQPIISGLQRPVDLQPDGSGRLFVIEKAGRIRIFQNNQLIQTPFLDITDRVENNGNEQGLLGLVFHPQYAQNGLFFVNYTDTQHHNVIARFKVSSDPNVADPNSEQKLISVEDPFPNHN